MCIYTAQFNSADAVIVLFALIQEYFQFDFIILVLMCLLSLMDIWLMLILQTFSILLCFLFVCSSLT